MTDSSPYIWGVDAALKGVAVAITGGDEPDRLFWFEAEKTSDKWRRINGNRENFKTLLKAEMVAERKPSMVWIEDTHIQHVSAAVPLAWMVATLRLTCDDLLVPTFFVPNATWKAEVIGSGKATKELIREQLEAANPWLAGELPNFPSKFREDVCDALAIARYGRIQWERLS